MRSLNYLLAAFAFFSISCSHLSSVSTSSVPADRSKPVKAESYRFMFFLFNFNNNYVNAMAEDLADQCPNGKVAGVLTKHESITYFPLIAHAVQVTAEGYCSSSRKRKKKKKS